MSVEGWLATIILIYLMVYALHSKISGHVTFLKKVYSLLTGRKEVREVVNEKMVQPILNIILKEIATVTTTPQIEASALKIINIGKERAEDVIIHSISESGKKVIEREFAILNPRGVIKIRCADLFSNEGKNIARIEYRSIRYVYYCTCVVVEKIITEDSISWNLVKIAPGINKSKIILPHWRWRFGKCKPCLYQEMKKEDGVR